MRDFPTMHPRKGTGSKYSTRVKQTLLGGRRFDTETLVGTFPEYLASDMDIHLIDRENILSSSYQVENTYFVKVVTPRHLKAHHFLTWWRNIVFKMSRLDTPFASFKTPYEMVQYEYEAADHTKEHGGAIAKPYAYSEIDGNTDSAAILYEYVPNAGKVEKETKSLKAFEHVVLTMRKMHNGGYTHTSLPYHVVQTVPSGEPYVTDPIGRTADTDRARLLGVGFDISTLLARYTPYIGTLPALKTLGEHYSDVELVAAYKTAIPIQVTVPGTPPWVISHLRSSINEYASGDAVDTYLEIVGEQYDTTPAAPGLASENESSPYSTSEFIEAVMDSDDDSEPEMERSYGDPLDDTTDDTIRLGDADTRSPMTDPASDPLAESSFSTTTNDSPDEENDNTADDELKSPDEGLTWTGEPADITRENETDHTEVDESPSMTARILSVLTPSDASTDDDNGEKPPSERQS